MSEARADGPAAASLADLLRALWRHAEGQRAVLLAAYALLIGAELLRLASPWFIARAIDRIQQQGLAGLREAGVDLALVFATIAAGWALHAPGRILERNVACHVRRGFSAMLLQRLLRAPLAWHLQQHSGQTAHRVQLSSDALHAFAETQYVYVQNTVMLIGPLAALCLISPWVGIAAIVGFGLLGGWSLLLDRVLIRLSVRRNDAERTYHAAWLDTLAHMLTLAALRRFDGARRLILTRLDALFVPLRKIVVLNEAKWATVDVGSALLWCSLVTLYAWLASRGTAAAGAGIALGSLYMVYEYARRAETVMTVIAGDFSIMAGQQANFGSAQAILDAPQTEPPEALAATAWRELALDAVRPDRAGAFTDAPAWQLKLQRGRRYALVGASGAGKSTLLRLLAGLEPARAGAVWLDEAPADADRLRREATLIPQESQLFVGTLAENLTLGAALQGRLGQRALAEAHADDFAAASPEGLAASVAENGGNWSGGQRQRLALARGLLAAEGSSLVLLDEPTSALDGPREAEALARVLDGVRARDGACAVVALHRLALLHLFDEVIVMHEGRIVDQGGLEALRVRCAPLRQLLAAVETGAPRPAPSEVLQVLKVPDVATPALAEPAH
jgi:ABC-type multidrug transport system fused ATPase/permease subunit